MVELNYISLLRYLLSQLRFVQLWPPVHDPKCVVYNFSSVFKRVSFETPDAKVKNAVIILYCVQNTEPVRK